ncbi:MAG TPA: hypothetical protein PKZ34_02380 [Thermotogota bacterium]|jgi:hypothetical protein|nr:hypothetical protein [Thermotogota bacterium]NLZ12687.1 hypothetical protein [Thermotogaceae bacterium]MDD8040723.1 hypothetical protein [Thermotogota bacterium]MDD8053086.1 hypothetical protein [Thermotogota bacterium]HPB86214.1 hypothetical protein [Thermotogota bacterium]
MKCECLTGCPFFNDKMKNMPQMANTMKSKYCEADFNSCARHRVFVKLGKAAVPADLFPHQQEEADRILGK